MVSEWTARVGVRLLIHAQSHAETLNAGVPGGAVPERIFSVTVPPVVLRIPDQGTHPFAAGAIHTTWRLRL
jgi:hypothetical protein